VAIDLKLALPNLKGFSVRNLKYINKPVGVSEYKIFDKLNKEIQSKLPIKEEIDLYIDLKSIEFDEK